MSPLNIVGSVDKLIFGLRLTYFFADIDEVDRALDGQHVVMPGSSTDI